MKRHDTILNQDMKKYILGYCQLSEEIILVELKGEYINIAIAVYASTAQITEEKI